MKKQTKLVAVLSTAALLAIGASMTSFAATGWAEEDGTWVYYDRNGDKVTDKWAKSGNNWYYLDGNGEMAVDQLIEDGDNYYYVDVNGVMAANQWVAIDNEDAGQDDEPEHYWYYFQANGKALKQGDSSSSVALKTVNGKKYAFDDEGKMLYGWVAADSAERIDNTDGDAFKEGDYYFGGEDDGAMKTNKTSITIDGDSFNFYFEKSGSNKGAGVNGEKDDKYYLAGMLIKAGSDEKYQVVKKTTLSNGKVVYTKLDDAKAFLSQVAYTTPEADSNDKITIGSVTKKSEDIKEAYVVTNPTTDYFLVNTSGSVIDKNSKSKDGDDYVYVTQKGGKILGVYVED